MIPDHLLYLQQQQQQQFSNMNKHSSSYYLRPFYLSCLSMIYFIAFVSYYHQYPALSSKHGIMPSESFFNDMQKHIMGDHGGDSSLKTDNIINYYPLETAIMLFRNMPTLAWFMPISGFMDLDSFHDSIAIFGIVLSSISIFGFHHAIVYFFLWVSYLTCYFAGQTFYSFQWDILLLEVGFASILYAPLWSWPCGLYGFNFKGHSIIKSVARPIAPVTWLLRWILFKLMFMAGVVKIQSKCDTWMNLTALEYHYATQCLPTFLSWWAHQLPPIIQRLSVAITLYIEIPLAFCLIAPLRPIRKIGVICQVILMVMIMLTGNYNFFNLMVLVLCIPCWEYDLYEDRAINSGFRQYFLGNYEKALDRDGPFVWLSKIGELLEEHYFGYIICYALGIWFCWQSMITMFAVNYLSEKDQSFDTENYEHVKIHLLFTSKELIDWVGNVLPLVMTAFGVGLGMSCTRYMSSSYFFAKYESPSRITRIWAIANAMFISVAVFILYSLSVVPMASLNTDIAHTTFPQSLVNFYSYSQAFHFSSGYGLFRRMTGVGDSSSYKPQELDPNTDQQIWGWGTLPPSIVERPEIIIQGSSDDGQTWQDIHFRYKPGDVMDRPGYIFPYQPRLDWQMWFAALGSYQQNLWFIHLMDKILEGNYIVLQLLDYDRYPFKDQPPPLVKATLYHYDFTRLDYPWNHRIPGTKLVSNGMTLKTFMEDPVEQKRLQNSATWSRKLTGEYFPVIERRNPSLTSILDSKGWTRSDKIENSHLRPGNYNCKCPASNGDFNLRCIYASKVCGFTNAARAKDTKQFLKSFVPACVFFYLFISSMISFTFSTFQTFWYNKLYKIQREAIRKKPKKTKQE